MMRNKKKVFIIAEAGSNWRAGSPARDLKRAKALIDAAARAGADAVKFQTYRASGVYVPNAGASGYLAKSGIRDSIVKIFRYLEMPYEMVPVLAAYCKKRKIEFMTSVFSEQDFEAVDPHVKRHKIASYEIGHARLIERCARSRKPLILSTGAATLGDIDWAVGHFRKHGGRELSLMQCTAKYPAPVEALNLKAIGTLKTRYERPTGFSDHSREPLVAPVAAVALGATLIEKHFTMDNNLPGPDHAFAVTPPELKSMVEAIRATEKALGTGKKIVLPEEEELRAYARRGLQAIKDIQKGERFVEGGNFAILRPGNQRQGVHPKFLSVLKGKRSRRFIPLGDGIQRKDVAS